MEKSSNQDKRIVDGIYRLVFGKEKGISKIRSGIGVGLGHPDLIHGNMVIEAKGGLPSYQKVRTALGQLLFYDEQEQGFRLGFLFPKIWLETENLQNDFNVLRKHGIILLPI